MRVLVTGGGGYIGSTLVSLLLDAGHHVRVLDALCHGGEALLGVWSHPRFEFVRGDIRDSALARLAAASMEAVVHLAAVVGDPACARAPDLARAVNLEGSLTVLAAAREAGVGRFVFASTCSNYGRSPDPATYLDEASPLRPVSLYAETKVAVERLLLDRAAAGPALCPTVLRLATVFGVSPRMRFDLTVNEFTAEMLRRRHLVVYGEQFWRPYVHVRDVGRAIVRVLGLPTKVVGHEVFNVGDTGENYQKQQLVELIRPHAPEATVEYVPREEDPRDYRVSFERARTRLGFEATRTVPDGIAEVAALLRSGIVGDWTDGRYRN